MKIEKKCKQCGEKFLTYQRIARPGVFCSRKCLYIFNDKRINKGCLRCKKIFKSRFITAKFCSVECTKKRIQIICKFCKKEFPFRSCWAKRGQGKFCSPECYGKEYSKERAPGWKGGITPINALLRTSTKYKRWHKQVLERDRWNCQECGKHGGKLHVDHIKQFAYYPELRFKLSNGRTLCVGCHINTLTYGNNVARY